MSSPDIQFSQIPSNIRKPGQYFEFNTSLAIQSLPQNLYTVMIVGQMLATGNAAALTPIQVFSDQDAAAKFGWGSIVHLMARAALKANPYAQIYVCGQPDSANAPVAATGTITITGTPTATGMITVSVGNSSYQVGISATDTPTTIAANIVQALNADQSLPVTYVAAAGVITFTAKNKGTVCNQVALAATLTAPGVTAVCAGMSGGSVDPNVQDCLTACFSGSYGIYATPYNDQANLTSLRTDLENLSGPLEQRSATGVYGFTGTLAAATTLAGEINDGRMVGAFLPGTPSAAFEIAAAMASVEASESDPARPLDTLELLGIGAPPSASRLSRTEEESCLWNGVTPLEVGPDGNVQIVRAVSTYTLNAQGVADPSLLDITTIRSLDYIRVAARQRVALRFPRVKIYADTPTRAGTCKQIRSCLIDLLNSLQDLQIVQNVSQWQAAIVVQPDSQDVNRVDAQIPADIVNGLHVFAGVINLILLN
jgi:phage tail sheath gpL-like